MIWRGWGALSLLPLILACVVFVPAVQMGFPHRGDGPQTGAVLMLIGVGFWLLGRRLNRGAKSFREAPHSLYWIPMHFYAIPLFGAGALMTTATLLAPQ